MSTRSRLRYDVLELERTADEARRLAKCEGIYHRGQELAWNGREVLPALVEKHGPVQVDDQKAGALRRIFTTILWGELAAWKVSSQLAAELEPIEAKMAATSQAFDEARHFTTMHEYLKLLGYSPEPLSGAPRALLDLVVGTRSLPCKMLGMQLVIEPVALTIFQTIRELGVEPVLSEMLESFERDEARHVGLGSQYLPLLIRDMSKAEVVQLMAFQMRLVVCVMREMAALRDDLIALGIDGRKFFERGLAKLTSAVQSSLAELGLEGRKGPAYRAACAMGEYIFPRPEHDGGRMQRLRGAWRELLGAALRSEPETCF